MRRSCLAVTVTLHVAVALPSAVVTETVALPAPTAVTVPSSETVAAAVLLLVQMQFSAPETVSFVLPPSTSVSVCWSSVRVTDVSGVGEGAGVTSSTEGLSVFSNREEILSPKKA